MIEPTLPTAIPPANSPTGPTDRPPQSSPPAEPPNRKKRRWLRVLGILVVLLLVLVALLPTLAGIGPVRSIVLSQAQAFVPHGKLDVADWSLGWFSPIRVSGVKLYDEKGQVVLEADQVKTDLSLLKAIRQKFDLSGTVVDAAAHIVVYPNGSTNLQHVLGLDEVKPVTTHAEPHPEKESKPAAVSKLPDVTGDITLKLKGDVRLVDAAEATTATVRLLPGSGGTIRITNINQPVDADLQFLYDTGESTKDGRIAMKASVDAIEHNQIDLAQLAATLDLPIKDVDLAGLSPLLAIGGAKEIHLAGVVGGDINGELKPGQAGSIKGKISIVGFEAGAPQLKDTYRAATLSVPISLSRDVESGASRLNLSTGIVLPDSSFRVEGNLSEAAAIKLAAGEMPADAGTASIAIAADLKKLADAFPKTVAAYMPDVAIANGTLLNGVTFTMAGGAIRTKIETNLVVEGTKSGKPISVQPVTFSSDATLTRLDHLADGVRDLLISFESGFATFNASGKSLTTLQGNGQADLQKAQQQAAQLIDLGKLQLAGTARFSLASQTSATDATATHADLGADVTGLKVTLPDQPTISLALARVAAKADLVTDSTGLNIQQIKTANATVSAGENEKQPLVDLALTATAYDMATQRLGNLTVSKCDIPSLPRLQQFIDPFVPTLREQKIQLADGSINAVIEANDIDLATTKINLTKCDATLPKLRVLRDGQELINDTMTVGIAGMASQTGDVMTVDISKLSVASALLAVNKAEGPLKVELQGGLPRGSGVVNVGVDAVQANKLARLMAGPSSAVPQVTAGRFDGKLVLAGVPGKNATIGFSGTLGGLTLANTPVQNESYTVDTNAAVTPDFGHINASLRVKGDFFSVVGKDISVKKPAAGTAPQQAIENAVFEIGVKDLAKAQTILSALLPGVKLPLDTAGALAINATVAKGAITMDLTGGRLTAKNSAGQAFAFDPKRPITMKLAATIDGTTSIDGLHVTSLDGDFDVATIKMAEPIVISGLSTTPTAKGKITLAGDFNRLLPLLAVIQQAQKPMPYAGRFSFTQAIAPMSGSISLTGDGTITDFAVLDDTGKATFKESQIKIANDLSADLNKQVATINSLTLDMASSKAATVAMNGGVEDWTVQRNLKNVTIKVDAVGEKIWPILYAMMAPAQQEQFKDAKLTGPIQINLTANGSYPAKPTWNESVRTVVAYGGINVAGISTMGLDVDTFVLPFSLVDNGKLITGDTRKKGAARFAKPFNVNKGSGDFGSIVIDVGNPNLLLSIGRKQKILQKVQINTVLAKQLGSLASAIFEDADNATGELDLTAVECQNVPLMELMNKKASASFLYNVHKLVLNGPVPDGLAQALQWGTSGIAGEINNASLVLKNGMANQDMTLELEHDNIKAKDDTETPKTKIDTVQFKGGINLAGNTFKDYNLILSQGLFPTKVRKKFPDGATVALKGKVTDIKSIIIQASAQLLLQGFGEDAVDKLLGKDKGDGKESPVDKLFDKLKKKKK